MDFGQARQVSAQARARLRQRIAIVALIVTFLLSFIGFNAFNDYATLATGGDNPFKQVVVIAVCTLLLIFTHTRNGWRRTLALPVSILVLFAYCLLTSSWAIAPAISFRRLTLTVLAAWSIFRVVGELGPILTLTCLRNIAIVLVVASYPIVLLTPYGTHHGFMDPPDIIGTWRGIFPQKNVAGEFLSVTILLLAFDPIRTSRGMRIGALVAAGFFLFKSDSRTAMGVLAVALAVGWVLRSYHPRHLSRAALALLAVMVLLLPIASVYAGDLIAVVADPHGFSGRGHVWELVFAYAQDHLWRGVGFQSFWLIGPLSPILTLTDDWVAIAVGHAHNGYLDLLVTIGIPGLVLAVLVVFMWPTALLLLDEGMPAQLRGLYAGFLVYIFGDNMTETSLLDRNAILEVVLMMTLALIHQSAAASAQRNGSEIGAIYAAMRRRIMPARGWIGRGGVGQFGRQAR